MMLQEVRTYLIANGIGSAADAFYANMPDKPDSVVCLYEYAGKPPEFSMDGSLYQSPGLQAVARAASYSDARAKIQAVYDLLNGKVESDLGGHRYHLIVAAQEPFPLGTDENGRHRLAVNFEVTRKN